jgi:hypothetical protein
VRNEKPVVHLLLLAPRLNQLVGGKLALAKVLQNFTLLLSFAKHVKLTAAQVLQLGVMIVQGGDSTESGTVSGQLKLHFHDIHALVESLLKLGQRSAPIHFCLIPLLVSLHHLTSDHLEALALAPLKTLPTSEHGL